MKTVLAVAAALGLSVSVAAACPMKRDTTASADKEITKEITTASLQTPISTSTKKEEAE